MAGSNVSGTVQVGARGGTPNPHLVLWHLGKKPEENDWSKKLGEGNEVTHGIAALSFDKKTGLNDYGDGFTFGKKDKPDIPSYLKINPDNWVVRLYDENGRDGKGKAQGLWENRLVIDHTNKQDERECRGTMLLDQCKKQRWGWLMDVVRLTDRKADLEHKELTISRAGFTEMIYKKNVEKDKRVAAAIKIDKNAGHVADREKVAQFQHIFCFLPTFEPKPSKVGQTQAAPGQTGAGDSECDERPNVERELGLRGDTAFWFESGRARFQMTQPAEPPVNLDGLTMKVHLYVDPETGSLFNSIQPLEDKKSNFDPIKKIPRRIVKGWIKIPGAEEGGDGDERYDYSYHSDPPPEDSSGSGSSGAAGTPTPPGSSTHPNGDSRPAVETPSAQSGKNTKQSQHGWAEPESPRFTQRTNILPKDATLNTMGTVVLTQPANAENVKVQLLVKPSAAIPAGKSTEINVFLAQHKDFKPPTDVYFASFTLDENTLTTEWTKQELTFNGFTKGKAVPMTILVERRNDLANNPDVEIWIQRTQLLPVY